jgi:hypothetical protein
MGFIRRFGADARLAYVLLISAILLASSGCTSIVTRSPDGRPSLYGLGWVKELETTEGLVFRVLAPGLSLRVTSYGSGWTLGFHELLLFLATDAEGKPDPVPVAIQTRAYGIDLTLYSVSVGFDRTFVIPHPKKASTVQLIFYSQTHPKATSVFRKEVP